MYPCRWRDEHVQERCGHYGKAKYSKRNEEKELNHAFDKCVTIKYSQSKWFIDRPVCCKLLTNEPSRDLGHYVSPEEGAVDHTHRFWIPVELSFLWGACTWNVKLELEPGNLSASYPRPLTTTTCLLSLKMVWLLTMLTMATPKLHRIPKEMQKPMPDRMAMM